MEGRVQPTEVPSSHDHHRREDISLNLWLDTNRLTKEVEKQSTYVVQMPRDQVYRLPPPEHARIVEGYRNITKGNKGRKLSCCCMILIAIVVLGFGIGIFIGVSHLLFCPKSPVFHLTSIQAKNLDQNKQHLPPSFDVVIAVSNPNSGISAAYKSGGTSSLIFNKVVIGEGQTQPVSKDVNLRLVGTKDASSKDINAALNDTVTPKSMILKVDIIIEMRNWLLTRRKDSKVTCDLNVKSLGKNTAEILSEKCQTDF
ncbi:hypothetical protein LIER_27162 [Lithospermum erythrorhizon]|uniref:Late embryogenesis abundant protein LEA-2 subgroup domain-containing protein n=1 Tax=Lithospermum erythrorhizon TaxID=34254 RepID=A0AAV3RBB6_LITER